MKLLIAIPALNEEDGIESIIQRSLAARKYICANSQVTEVDITVVSDGSTDRTVEIASQYTDRIKLIVFPQNKGYGAAIQEAWRQSEADILGFLDADGTCDPQFFASLCAVLESKRADVALGCRLNANSQMPPIRRLGNRMFGFALTLFAASSVRDTASGMRVVRRVSLSKLLPLPAGLHFTPAMSARAMLSDSVEIVEIDMPYHERTGESKLRVIKDGFRFLRVILEAAFLYRPSRPLTLAALAFFAGAAVLMVQPAIHYLQYHSVYEWMIYRFLVSSLLGTCSCLAFCGSYLADRAVSIALTEEISGRQRKRFFRSKLFWLAPIGLMVIGLSLVLASLLDLLSTGATFEHWSRYVVMSFCFSIAAILSATRLVDFVLNLMDDRVKYLRSVDTERPGLVSAHSQRNQPAAGAA